MRKKTKYQAVVQYHSSLMDDYRTIWWNDYNTKEEAEQGLEKYWKEHPIDDSIDPENPLSDLYDSFIHEIEE